MTEIIMILVMIINLVTCTKPTKGLTNMIVMVGDNVKWQIILDASQMFVRLNMQKSKRKSIARC